MTKPSRSWVPLLVMFILVAMASLTRAEAFVRDVDDPCPTYEDCAYGSPTWEGGFNNPTPTACYAKGVNKQSCRSCEPAYFDNGKPKGYDVCAYVESSANCRCKFEGGCRGEGNCTYSFY